MSRCPGLYPDSGTRRRESSKCSIVEFDQEEHSSKRSVSYSGIFDMEDLHSSGNTTKLDDDVDAGERKREEASAGSKANDNIQRQNEDRGRTNGGRNLSSDHTSCTRTSLSNNEAGDKENQCVIFRMISQKDVEGIRELMKLNKIDENDRNSQGETILMAAVETRSEEMVEEILSIGVDVDGRGKGGVTAFHVACRNNDGASVRRLMAAGCTVNSVQDDGCTPLHSACQHGDAAELVQLLLDSGASIQSTRTKDRISGYTALHLAAEVGDSGSVRALLSRCPDAVNAELSDSWTALHVACRHGYIDVTRALLDNGARVNSLAEDARGSDVSPLHLAVDNNHLFVAKTIIDSGAVVDAARTWNNRTGLTGLHLAVVKRNADMVKLLLDNGCPPNAQDSDGCSALHIAARTGQLGVVQLLVRQGAELNLGMSSKQSVNQTPLHLAVRFRHYEVAKQLIRAGCSVNVPEKMAVSRGNTMTGQSQSVTDVPVADPVVTVQGSSSTLVDAYTPLHWAVENGDLEMVCLLLDSDAQPNTAASFDENTGLTPLHLAAQDGYSRIAEELLRCPGCDRNPFKRTLNRENITPLHQATYNGHVDAVKVLLENHCDVNIQADNGYCALHYAAQQGELEMTRMILRHGGQVQLLASAKDQLNITALHMSVQSGNASVVQALVDAGSRIDAQKTMGDIQGVTPLHQAVYQEKAEIVEMLLELGASVRASMNGWYTALHVAAEKGSSSIVTILLQKSADPNAKASHKDHAAITPLHVASQHGHTEVVRQLVDAGADLQATRDFADRTGITALHLAVESGYEDTARTLVELGSEKNAQDSLKFTPLHVAVQYSFPNIVRFLLDAECDTKRKTVSGLTAARMAEQLGNVSIRQMFKDERRKSTSISFRHKNLSNQNQNKIIDSDNKNDKRTSNFMRLLCGLKRN